MSKALELIVAGYVKVRDRPALTSLLAHRRKVLAELQAVSGINPENAVRAIQAELALIEAGLEQLKPPPGSMPDNEWGWIDPLNDGGHACCTRSRAGAVIRAPFRASSHADRHGRAR